MKTIYNNLKAGVVLLSFLLTLILSVSCSDFTEIEPKGKNLLTTTDELNMLLNFDYSTYVHFGLSPNSQLTLIGSVFTNMSDMNNYLSSGEASTTKAYTFAMEDIDRAALTTNDNTYNDLYSLIGTVCNPILEKADAASGDDTAKRQYKAEAYVLRAWAHYMLVNTFAKAYNAATAATDPGICLLKEGQDLQADMEKATVAEVYASITEDLDAALALNALPVVNINRMRVNLPFAYAVKAKVEMSMGKYSEALTDAQTALDADSHVDDYRQYVGSMWTHPQAGDEEDYFMIPLSPAGMAFTEDQVERYGEGWVLYDTFGDYETIYGIPGALIYGVPCKVWIDMASYTNGYGIKTTDMMLTKAECLLRSHDVNGAMAMLDGIRINRIDDAHYTPLAGAVTTEAEAWAALRTLVQQENALSIWSYLDLKRWNTEDALKQNIEKHILGQTYTVTPESPLWISPFALDVVSFDKKITQNY